MATATETEERPTIKIRPFGIQADHPRNSDVMVQCIPNCRLRSRITAGRTVTDAKNGQQYIPVDQSRHLAAFPEIPGMELHVDPVNCKYVITDPINDEENEDLRRKIRSAIRAGGQMVEGEIRGPKTIQGSLDVHSMKTLVRELATIVKNGHAKVVKGNMPDMEEIGLMPGKFLLNPGSRVHNTQPRFEEDWDTWLEQLTKSGG